MAQTSDNDPIQDRELPDESDMDSPEEMESQTEPCPYCGRQIYDRNEWCPHCGKFILQEDGPSRKAVWIVVGVTICIVVVVSWVMLR
jgi:hypothetical protein